VIHYLDSSFEGFRRVEFNPGLNLVLADRTEESTEFDSRNGLGKTSVVHLIQFCLGGSLPDHLSIPRFEDVSFELCFDVGRDILTVRRGIEDSNRVMVQSETRALEQMDLFAETMPLAEYKKALFQAWFAVKPSEAKEKYAPSFRALMNYFGRRRHDAFVSPLKHFHSQPGYQQQIHHAFLCGMDWRYPRDQRLLHEEERDIRALKRAAESGVLDNVVGTAGELLAEKVQIERRLHRLRGQLEEFEVHPNYQHLHEEADRLSMRLRALADERTKSERLKANYLESLAETRAGMSRADVEAIYRNVEVSLPELVINRIDEVREFHDRLTSERLEYLNSEIEQIDQCLVTLSDEATEVTSQRVAVLETLRTHGSLEDFRAIKAQVRDLELELAQVKQQLATRNRIDTGGDEIHARRLEKQERARARFQAPNELRERVVSLFDEFWEQLYGHGGRLIIDLTNRGYSFDWEVEREGSEGVGRMKIFAYDLAIATAWAERNLGPRFLIHDSTIWDGVDERQIAGALRLAPEICDNSGLQYITMMNSDVFPATEDEEAWEDLVAIRLTDKTDEGRLFGVQF